MLSSKMQTTSTLNGQRMVFEFESVSEQTPVRKMCNIPIPEFKEHHEGAHSHCQTENVQHNWELPMGHLGHHQTTHGNMRGVHFVSESEDIDICERKFLQMGRVWGSRDVCNALQGTARSCHLLLISIPNENRGRKGQ